MRLADKKQIAVPRTRSVPMPPIADKESHVSTGSALRARSTNETQHRALTECPRRRTESVPRTQQLLSPTKVTKAVGVLSQATARRSESHHNGPEFPLSCG